MTKKTWVICISSVCVFLLICGGGYWWWQAQYKRARTAAQTPLVAAVSSPDNVLGADLVKGIPLNGESDDSNEGGLRVTTNGGIGGGLEQSTGGQGSGSSSASKASGPESFSQYDKYKDGKDALYMDLVSGNGAAFDANKKGAVYYKGWLTTGELFDQSKPEKPGGELVPFVFTMGEHKVIPGWESGLYGMKVGGTRRVIVPPAMGYGDQGQGPIPPGAVMVFDVQLLAVQ